MLMIPSYSVFNMYLQAFNSETLNVFFQGVKSSDLHTAFSFKWVKLFYQYLVGYSYY